MRKQRLIRAMFLLLGLPILALYNACTRDTSFSKLYGSVSVGNPMVSNEILLSVCGVISRCNPQVTSENCQSGILGTSGFGNPLGLSANYSTFNSVVQGESTGALVGNVTAGSNCFSAINGSSCSDPNVVGAYNPTQSNPFAGSPNMIPVSSCNQVFAAGVSLEVPVELVDVGLSSQTTPLIFSRTLTSLNTADYDGTVTYSFEMVGINNDGLARNVSLVDSSGSKVAAITIPAGTSVSTRMRIAFTPTPGSNNYRIQLDGSTVASQMNLSAGRILVSQIGATQTKIYVPLVDGGGAYSAGDVATPSDSIYGSSVYIQGSPDHFSLWRKNDSAFKQLASNNPWTFEAVLSATGGGTTFASIFDASTGLQVATSEVSTTSSVPALVSVGFSDSAANFTNLDNINIQIKNGAGNANLYHGGIWIKLTNLAHGEIYYRSANREVHNSGDNAGDFDKMRLMPTLSLFNLPTTIYNEVTSHVTASGTSCMDSIFDNGTADSGLTGFLVGGSSVTVSSPTAILQRSGPFSLTGGDRFTYYLTANPGPGDCIVNNAFLVIAF